MTAYEEALEIINDAIKNNETRLNLRFLGLKSEDLKNLFPKILELNPKSLRLGNNQLTSLPPEIGQLENLEVLALNENQITSLPTNFENLKRLKKLYLSTNQITNVPIELCSLTELEYLDLRGNEITCIPAEVGNLTVLEYLDLTDNQITSLPAKIEHLKRLKGLDLSRNQITSLPAEVGNLTVLEYIDLSDNQIATLPEAISNLNDTLNQISIDNNPLNEETMHWLNATFGNRAFYNMEAYVHLGNYNKVIDRLYGTKSEEIKDFIDNLKGKYQVLDGVDKNGKPKFSEKTGAFVINDFWGKATSNRQNALSSIYDTVIKYYLDQVLSDDEVMKDAALNEMATALGACETPVQNLVMNKAISLYKENPNLFDDLTLLETILERAALEDYLIRNHKLLHGDFDSNTQKIEYIEKLHGLLNSVYLKDAETNEDNKIKISGERKRLPSTSAYPDFSLTQVPDEWIKPFVKICCQTDTNDEPVTIDGKYILDPEKLNLIKNLYLLDNELRHTEIKDILKEYNDNWNKTLQNTEDMSTYMLSISKENEILLNNREDELKIKLLTKKDTESKDTIVTKHLEENKRNLYKVIASKHYKDALAETSSETASQMSCFIRPINGNKNTTETTKTEPKNPQGSTENTRKTPSFSH